MTRRPSGPTNCVPPAPVAEERVTCLLCIEVVPAGSEKCASGVTVGSSLLLRLFLFDRPFKVMIYFDEISDEDDDNDG